MFSLPSLFGLRRRRQAEADKHQDVWRVANRIFKPSAHTKPLNFGLGSGAPTIVGMGKNVESLGDVKQTLRNWGLGRQ